MTKFSTVINYGDVASGQFIKTLPFIPDTVIVDNQSPYTVYGRIGGSDIPTSLANADVSVLPLTYKTFPINSEEVAFGFGLPTVAPKQPGYQNSAQLTFTAGEPSAFQAPLVPPQSLQTLDVVVDTLSNQNASITNRQVSVPDGTRSILMLLNGDVDVAKLTNITITTNIGRAAYYGIPVITTGGEPGTSALAELTPYFNIMPNENTLTVNITYGGSSVYGYTMYAMSDWVIGRPWDTRGIPIVRPLEIPTDIIHLNGSTVVTGPTAGAVIGPTIPPKNGLQYFLTAVWVQVGPGTSAGDNVICQIENVNTGTPTLLVAQAIRQSTSFYTTVSFACRIAVGSNERVIVRYTVSTAGSVDVAGAYELQGF